MEIEVTGHQWWWEVEYKHQVPSRQVTAANEIRLPLHQRVLIRTNSSDAIHSLWIPNLHGKRDLIPARTSGLWPSGLFAIPVMDGLGLYLVPLMIGTRSLPFPRLNNFSYYMYVFGGTAVQFRADANRAGTLRALAAPRA